MFKCVLYPFLFFALYAYPFEIKDNVVFEFKGDVITESDLKAFAYIFRLDPVRQRKKLIDKVVKIEKRYCCLKESYPFEDEFEREYPQLFYQLNLFYTNRFLPSEKLKKYNIDYKILNHNLFKLLFVIKYGVLLNENENGCLKEDVYFSN